VACEQGQGGGVVPDVERADEAVDAGGGDGVGAVLVPVVGEGFGGLEGGGWTIGADWVDVWGFGEGCVDGDRGDEVVCGRCGGAEVEDAEVGVGGDGRQDGGRVWTECRGVGAGMGGKGGEGLRAMW
jgi:hypothetical protein